MKKYIKILLCIALMLPFASCEKTDVTPSGDDTENKDDQTPGNDEQKPGDDEQKPADDLDVICYYEFNGEQRPFRSAVASRGEGFYSFIFTEEAIEITEDGRLDSSNVKSFFEFMIDTTFIGWSYDVERLYHNDNYYFIYDTPDYYFSPAYGGNLRSGTIFIDDLGTNRFHVQFDVKLANGMPFVLDYNGLFSMPYGMGEF